MGLLPEEAEAGYALACQARLRDRSRHRGRGPAGSRRGAASPPRDRSAVSGASAADVTHLTLELPGLDAFSYLPGQHVSILMDDGRPRSFSMASAPNGNRFDLHIRRIPGGVFTDGRLPGLTEGERGSMSNCRSGRSSCASEDFRPLLMVATGTGLAPIKSILESLMDDPDCPPSSALLGHARAGGPLSPRRGPAMARAPVRVRVSPGAVAPRRRTGKADRGYVQDAVIGGNRGSLRIRHLSLRLADDGCSGQGAASSPAVRASTTSTPTASSSSTIARWLDLAAGRQAIDCAISLFRSGISPRPPAATRRIAVVFCIRYAEWESRVRDLVLLVGGLGGRWR